MWFNEIIETKSHAPGRPMMQKDAFPVNETFRAYLKKYRRDIEVPVLYSDLVNYSYADALKDKKGKWTHWENAVYEPGQLAVLKQSLIKTYLILKKGKLAGNSQFDIERIDFCEYGNSIPFRIKVIGKNNYYDFFYIKQADASRIYGLELEHLLTNNPVNFLCFQNTLIEEHIKGIPGDVFLQQNQQLTQARKAEISKAFVQFNESCFTRLLGDMRSYNFVINPILSDENTYYNICAIDFDQQSYEGRKYFYFPKSYQENSGYVTLVMQNLTATEIEESRQMQFIFMAKKIVTHRRQLMELVNSMVNDEISENYKIQGLRNELNEHFNTQRFTSCKTMGAIVKQQLKQVLQKYVKAAGLK